MAPTSGEDTDLVQWAFDTLVNSYEDYHEGECEGKESRPLRTFASEMPQLTAIAPPPKRPVTSSSLFVRGLGSSGATGSSREKKRGESRKHLQQEHSDLNSDAQSERHSEQGNRASGSGFGQRTTGASRRVESKVDVSASERGPVPPPFGKPEPSNTSTQEIHCDEVEDDTIEAPKTAEDFAVWMQYYQQCAEYMKQCSEAAATADGSQPPPSTTAPAVASTATAPISQVPATASRNASMLSAQQDDLPNAFRSPCPRDSGSAPLNGNLLRGASVSGVGGLPQPFGGSYVGSPNGQFASAMHTNSVAPHAGNVMYTNASGHMASSALLGNSVFPSSFAPNQGGLPVIPGLSLGRSAVLSGCSQNICADEELANLLMAWYWSGYHTGHFAARQGR